MYISIGLSFLNKKPKNEIPNLFSQISLCFLISNFKKL